MARTKKSAVVVGGGMIGLVTLTKLRKAGIEAILIDRGVGVGGLWRTLPDWQEIQSSKEDWTLNGIPIEGTAAPQIVQTMERWVRKYRLEKFLRLGTTVQRLEPLGAKWKVHTDKETFESDAVVVCCGPHGKPHIPAVERQNAALTESHTGRFTQPELLRGKRVTVVGGGASAFDAIELALQYDAKAISWVFRNPRWMVPSKQKKTARSQLRKFGMMQWVMSDEAISRFFTKRLTELYGIFAMDAILPNEPMDILTTQLVPGRPDLIRRLEDLRRYRGKVPVAIDGKTVRLNDGSTIETDVLLWATGFKLDLSFTGLPQYEKIDDGVALRPLLGTQVKSLDYDGLYFSGQTFGDGNTLTAVASSWVSNSVANDILGRCAIGRTPVLGNINLLRTPELFAQFDKRTYGFLWRPWLRLKWTLYARFPKMTMRF